MSETIRVSTEVHVDRYYAATDPLAIPCPYCGASKSMPCAIVERRLPPPTREDLLGDG